MPDDFKPVTLVNSRGAKSVVYSAEQLRADLETGKYKISLESLPSTADEVVSREKGLITAPIRKSVEG